MEKQLTINGKSILAVEVPEQITEDLFYHPSGQMLDGWSKHNDMGQRIYWGLHGLPPGNWQILGKAGELTEEQLVEIGESPESWNSLCTKEGIQPNDLILILK